MCNKNSLVSLLVSLTFSLPQPHHLVFDSLQYVNVCTILSPPYLHTASHQKLLGVAPQRAL